MMTAAAACHDEDVGDDQQTAALNACTSRWAAEFRVAYEAADETGHPVNLAHIRASEIPIDSKGYFYVEQPYSGAVRKPGEQFICRGNLKSRTVEFVGYRNEIRRPGSGAGWRF